MRRYGKVGAMFAALASSAALAATLSVGCSAPDEAPAEAVTGVRTTPHAATETLANGKYLVDNVLLCMNCHSERDWSLYSGPITPGTEGRGGVVGIFGDDRTAPDISPEALSAWTSHDIVDAIVDGRDLGGGKIHKGWLLANYGILTADDALAVALYLKDPSGTGSQAASLNPDSGAARGSYLVTLGRCVLCHESDLAGGKAVRVPGMPALPSANITIDIETGVGRMNRAEFIDYFKSLSGSEVARIEVPPDTANTAMAWPQFSQMTRQDLGAIYDYLATRPAVRKTIQTQ